MAMPDAQFIATVSGILVFYWSTTGLFFLLRRRRLIKIRHVGYTVEFSVFSAIYNAFVCGQTKQDPNLSCEAAYLITNIALIKTWVPFLLAYRHIFLRYRFGVIGTLQRSSEPPGCLTAFSMRYCAYRRTFPRDIRILELLCIVYIVVVFLASPGPFGEEEMWVPRPSRECWVGLRYELGSQVHLALFAICSAFGRGIVKRFHEIAKFGDSLGIKKSIVITNTVLVLVVMWYLVLRVVTIATKGIELPMVLLYSPHYTYLFFHTNMILAPLWSVLRSKDTRSNLDTTVDNGGGGAAPEHSELYYLLEYIRSKEGHKRMNAFMVAELCGEAMQFICAVDKFRARVALLNKRRGSRSVLVGDAAFSSSANDVLDDRSQTSYVSFTNRRPQRQTVFKSALSIYNTFLHPEAPQLINAEGAHISTVREDLGIAKDRALDAGNISDDEEMGETIVEPTIFDVLCREQLELIYMDNFRRYLEDKDNYASWALFVQTTAELEAFEGKDSKGLANISKSTTTAPMQP